MVNQFEFHREITTKHRLIKNLINYFNNDLQKVFEITPITFVIDINQADFELKI